MPLINYKGHNLLHFNRILPLVVKSFAICSNNVVKNVSLTLAAQRFRIHLSTLKLLKLYDFGKKTISE